MGLKQVKYIKLDDQKGKLYASDRQSLLVSVDIVKALSDIFEKMVGTDSAKILMAKIGQGLGQGYVRSLEAILSKEGTEITQESKVRITIDAIFMESGWGKAEIKKLDLKKHIFEITMSNTPSQNLLKGEQFDLEGGIMAGVIKDVAGLDAYYEVKKHKDKNKVNIRVVHDKSKKLKEKEKMALLGRQELEERIAEATKTVSEEKEKLSSIITSLIDGLIMVDKSGIINIVNPRAESYLGVLSKEMIGKKLDETDLCDCFYDLFSKIKTSTKKKNRIHEMSTTCCFEDQKENKNKKEKGKKGESTNKAIGDDGSKYYNITAKAVIDSENKMIGCMLVIHDITREKVLDRMKNEFISIAAHQLRTPLSGIHWSLKMILDGEMGEINDEVKSYLERTLKSNNRLIKLVNDLLNVSRIEEGRFVYKPSQVNVEDIVRYVISNKKREMQKRNIEVKVEKTSSIPKIKADEEKIQIAISNILDNAIKYSYKNGAVIVELSKTKIKNRTYVRVKVCDNGVGIEEKDKDRLFTKFYRGSKAAVTDTEGSGLGLFIVKNIVEAHNGAVKCQPRKDCRGTCVTIDLPLNNNLK